jgi:DinB superfamily
MEETRLQAIAILEQGQAAVRDLIDRLPASARTRPGIGGGDWSAKDLIGHLASWEEHALAALQAWAQDVGAPIDKALYTRGTNAVNAEAVAAKAGLGFARVLREADATHSELIVAIREMSEERWERPATSRGRKPLGLRLGQILGGPAGGFRHAQAHLKTLAAFVREWAEELPQEQEG